MRVTRLVRRKSPHEATDDIDLAEPLDPIEDILAAAIARNDRSDRGTSFSASLPAFARSAPRTTRLLGRAAATRPIRRVLHVGCGPASADKLHPIFRSGDWQEIRVDVDKRMRPDIAASIVDLSGSIEDGSCEAVWASHVVEHLDRHQLPQALRELHRILTPAGFVLIRCPDIESVAQLILDGRIEDNIYNSPAGPITPLDMIYGHGASIARGQTSMRHGTAFTERTLAQNLLNAGFAEVRTKRVEQLEIWAAGFRDGAHADHILDGLAGAGPDLRH